MALGGSSPRAIIIQGVPHMKRLVSYSLTTKEEDQQLINKKFDETINIVHSWLSSKGDWAEGKDTIIFRDGRKASILRLNEEAGGGKSITWILSEPVESGIFKTEIHLGWLTQTLAVYCSLSIHNPVNILSPAPYKAFCPNVIRDIVNMPFGWRVGTTLARARYERVDGRVAGERLAALIRDPSRSLPVLVVSQQKGLLLTPEISNEFAHDLTALALVVEIDGDASWELSERLGRNYSCFNGAIRLYWPGFDPTRENDWHPIWTSRKLIETGGDLTVVASRLREKIRLNLFDLSAVMITPSDIFEKISEASFHEEIAEQFREAEGKNTFRDLAESIARDNDCLKKRQSDMEEQNRKLREELYKLRSQQAWRTAEATEEQAYDPETLQTVAEAINLARRMFSGDLVFGLDVEESAKTLTPEAGPPGRVYGHLDALAELSRERRDNDSIGTSPILWLKERGIDCSGESETVRNNAEEMRRRQWRNGRGESIQFIYHLKPNEGAPKNKIVRIYFDWDEVSRTYVVGYIGKHF